MAKKKFSRPVYWLLKNLGLLFIKILGKSWRYQTKGTQPEQRVIYAFWHRNILPLLYLHRNQDMVVMISQSQDGQLVADAAIAMGYYTARGSSRRGGSQAVREMLKMSKTHSLGISPDGPKGPAKKIKEGLIFVAKATGLPVVLVTVDVQKEKVFNSWDKFRLPLPFSRIKVQYSKPFPVPRKADTQEICALLEAEMLKQEKQLKHK